MASEQHNSQLSATGREVIIGIDPGSWITGYGVVEKVSGQWGFVEAGTFSATSALKGLQRKENQDMPLRLKYLSESLQELFQQYMPKAVVLEKIFVGKNIHSAFQLGMVRGVCCVEVARSRSHFFEYTPREVKAGIAGRGGATKEEVAIWVRAELKIADVLPLDATDALALALFHCHQSHLIQPLGCAL